MCSVDWGLVVNALAAIGAIGAAVAALWIASRDRRERKDERHDEDRAKALLVRLLVQAQSNRPAFSVEVRNFGPLAVMDVELVDAVWSDHPGARWDTLDTSWQARGLARNHTRRPILMPTAGADDTFDTVVEFIIRFVHPIDDEAFEPPIDPRTVGYQHPSFLPIDLAKIVAKVQFTTADGVRWETPTDGPGAGAPVRLPSS